MGEGAAEVTERTKSPDDERDDVDQETVEKVMEIEQMREEMHGTVEAIGDRLSPAAITQSAKETVREATVGKVEDMAQSASRVLDDAGMTALEARTSIVETIRQNPLPAAMAGIGLAWLVTHRSPGYQTTRWQDSRRRQSWENSGQDAVGGGVAAVGDRASEIGDRVTGRVEDGVDAIGRRVDDVGQRVGEMPDEVRYRVYDLSEQARSLIEDSPLAVGAVAVAVGTVDRRRTALDGNRAPRPPACDGPGDRHGRAEGDRSDRPGRAAHERGDVRAGRIRNDARAFRIEWFDAEKSVDKPDRFVHCRQPELFQRYERGYRQLTRTAPVSATS